MTKLLTLTLLCLSGLAQAQTQTASAQPEQQNFVPILHSIQNSKWKGTFSLTALGVTCSGPLKVYFFPEQVEPFSGGATTVSYRHDADFSHNFNPLCDTLGKHFSVVQEGNCSNFPKKYNPWEKANVSYRTIIPRSGGSSAVVSSPSCALWQSSFSDANDRQEEKIVSMKLVDANTIDLIIGIDLKFRQVNVHYLLARQP